MRCGAACGQSLRTQRSMRMHFLLSAPSLLPTTLCSIRDKWKFTEYSQQRWSPRGRPWPRGRPRGHILKSLALASKVKSLALASSIPVLGLESVCPRKCCPWPWPRIFFVSLALASSLVSSTPPLIHRVVRNGKGDERSILFFLENFSLQLGLGQRCIYVAAMHLRWGSDASMLGQRCMRDSIYVAAAF